MVGAAIIFCTLVLAFFEKPHLFKKPIKFEKIIVLSLLIIVAAFSWRRDYNNDKQQNASANTIDSLHVASKVLTGMVSTLSKDNKIAQREYADSLRSYHKEDILQIQTTAYNMASIFGRESKNNLQLHLKTQSEIQKIDTNKLQPAHIGFWDSPTETLVVSFSANVLKVNVKITNTGDKVAYNLSWIANLVLEADNGTFYRYLNERQPFRHGYDMPSHLIREIEITDGLNEESWPKIKSIFCIVKGFYYIDESLKFKKDFIFAGKYEIGDARLQIYALDKDIETFYKEASIIH